VLRLSAKGRFNFMGEYVWQWLMAGGHVYIGIAAIFLSTGTHLTLTGTRSQARVIELLLLYSMGIAGFRGIFSGFVMHFFFADQVAQSIGWATGSPFQTEVAFANLAVGILGAATFWRRDFWLPYIIVSTILGWGAGFTHILDIVGSGNTAANNAGPILYADFLVPLVRIVLYVFYIRSLALSSIVDNKSAAPA
jgi:hypothetical protein